MTNGKKIACIVCNYNKQEYVVNCIRSLLEQTMEELDIYIIDNASEDDSVEILKKRYCDRVTVVVNEKNLGGSGGFNVGLRLVLKEDHYQYVVLIDNDVILEESAIAKMYTYMETHQDVGILGPKILQMAHPDIVQDLGGTITKRYRMQGNHYGMKDLELIEELDCAYISTCTAMARADAVKQFGLMPEENFIYWDDVEWSKKCQLAGYRTVAISWVRVWHNHSIMENQSNFTKYYLTRNMLKFFSKYLDESEIDRFIETMLEEIFIMQFLADYQGANEWSKTVKVAWEDFLNNRFGKAEDKKIPSQKRYESSFEKAFKGVDNVIITWDNKAKYHPDFWKKLFERFQKLEGGATITIYTDSNEIAYFLNKYNIKYKIVSYSQILDMCEIYYQLLYCEHIKLVKNREKFKIYIDEFLNCISSEEEMDYIRKYERAFFDFKAQNLHRFEKRVQILRGARYE